MARGYWLVKSEPSKYSWNKFVRDGSTYWDGVRNYAARNHLASMRKGDLVLYYHSNEGKEVVGVARVTREAYGDPTTEDERWLVVDLKPLRAFERSVLLAEIKSEPALKNLPLVRQSRLSVMPVERPHFEHILRMGKTRLPRR
ncbi:MAG: EVE domain-containing protein [Deltaproteobacteria bacterium]|nr:EVE domain-containing protein [Deltaproteobacteria bacterium]MCZ6823102.1 EVE domain-containing protein [Deltaproteobacteria bacterium]TDJ04248.1 MAG: EVE domain-containing protein [Deltaproteobacteria bacterium]